MLFLTSAHDLSSDRIIAGLKNAIDVTVVTELTPENIKSIDFEYFRSVFLKSQITIKGYDNSVEHAEILYYLNYLFGKKSISLYGQNFVSQPSKPMVLETAKSFGLSVPDYIVVNNKKRLLDFLKVKRRIICKSLESQNLFQFSDEPLERYNPYACEINIAQIASLDDNFFPSFFQEYINKDLELKVFYFKGVFFSAALIPNYNVSETDIKASAYRCVPYKIASDLEHKLNLLMTFFNWRMGSIDLLIKDDKVYFLEINPSGQFGNISYECGYDIESFIIKEIIKEYKNARI